MRYYVGTAQQNSKENILYTLFDLSSSQTKKIWYATLFSIGLYIFLPTISTIPGILMNQKKVEKFENRLDKKTTGLVNKANDCYANSSLQSLASLEALTNYLNIFYKTIITDKERKNDLNLESLKETIPLHYTLAKLLQELQQPIINSTTTSIQPITQALEFIYKTKISSNQNDAHEFTQIVLETLKQEYDLNKPLFSDVHFPFLGKISTQLVCVRCRNVSEIKTQDFLIYETITPQKYSANLNDILMNDQTDTIKDYSCLRCQINILLKNEKTRHSELNDEEREIVDHLENCKTNLFINSDIPPYMLNYIKLYNKDGCIPSMFKSQVVKKSVLVNTPDTLVIHLSRSSFNGMNSTRNYCRVNFEEDLVVSEQTIIQNKSVRSTDIRYRLRSIIKHTGTHYQGHYQCFRHKPDFVKDSFVDSVIITSPIIKLPDGYNIKPSGSIISKYSNKDKTQSQEKQGKKRYKKIKSVVKYPYWHISDTSCKEVSTNSVLSETKYVYLLYFEKV